MIKVRIFQPSKTAMQSGLANTRQWVLEFEPAEPKSIDPLMGWVSSGDTLGQVKLRFDSKDEAVAFADKNGHAYLVEEPHVRRIRPKSYAENFR